MEKKYKYNSDVEVQVFGNIVENQLAYLFEESSEDFYIEAYNKLTLQEIQEVCDETLDELLSDDELWEKIDEIITYYAYSKIQEIFHRQK